MIYGYFLEPCFFFLKVWFNSRSNIKLRVLVISIVSVVLFLHKHRLGKEEKGWRVVTTHLLTKVSGQLQIIKKTILASLCLASYLVVNWLQKLETKHCVYYAVKLFLFLCVCVCLCVWYGISVLLIYNKTKLTFCKMPIFVPYT